MTVKQNLEEMLEFAIYLKRPASEIAAIRAQLAAFKPETLAELRTKQDRFLSAV